MAETTQFVIEGDFLLAYFADDQSSRHVLIGLPNEVNMGNSTPRLETKIAEELDFPTDEEYDAVYAKINKMNNEGMRPDIDVPVFTRGTKLKITVEVIDDE